MRLSGLFEIKGMIAPIAQESVAKEKAEPVRTAPPFGFAWGETPKNSRSLREERCPYSKGKKGSPVPVQKEDDFDPHKGSSNFHRGKRATKTP